MARRKLQPKPSIAPRPRLVSKPFPRARIRFRLKSAINSPSPRPERKRYGGGGVFKPVNRTLCEGVWSDMFMITNAFDQSGSKYFKDFRLLCIEKKILDIFRGFTVSLRLELTETIISRCKEMWLESPTFEKQLTWFYFLCYMYMYQPRTLLEFSDLEVKVRLGINDHDGALAFVSQARIRKVEDVDSLMEVMHDADAILYCVTAYPYGLEKFFMQNFVEDVEKSAHLNNTLTFPRLVHSLQKLKLETKEALNAYCTLKEAVLSRYDNTNKDLAEGLSSVKVNLIDELFSCSSSDKQASVSDEAGPSQPVQSVAGPSKMCSAND